MLAWIVHNFWPQLEVTMHKYTIHDDHGDVHFDGESFTPDEADALVLRLTAAIMMAREYRRNARGLIIQHMELAVYDSEMEVRT